MIAMITYDLNKDKNYQRVWNAIEALGETRRDPGLDSVWFVDTVYSVLDIQNHFTDNGIIDKDDRFFISKLAIENVSGWLAADIVDWLHLKL